MDPDSCATVAEAVKGPVEALLNKFLALVPHLGPRARMTVTLSTTGLHRRAMAVAKAEEGSRWWCFFLVLLYNMYHASWRHENLCLVL